VLQTPESILTSTRGKIEILEDALINGVMNGEDMHRLKFRIKGKSENMSTSFAQPSK
jgi:hypothetical protein